MRDYLRCKSKLACENYCVQNSLSTPTKIFEECGIQSISPSPQMKIVRNVGTLGLTWSRVLPTKKNENLARLRDFGFELVHGPEYPTPPPKKRKLGQIEGLWIALVQSTPNENLCAETNCCIPCGYHLI